MLIFLTFIEKCLFLTCYIGCDTVWINHICCKSIFWIGLIFCWVLPSLLYCLINHWFKSMDWWISCTGKHSLWCVAPPARPSRRPQWSQMGFPCICPSVWFPPGSTVPRPPSAAALSPDPSCIFLLLLLGINLLLYRWNLLQTTQDIQLYRHKTTTKRHNTTSEIQKTRFKIRHEATTETNATRHISCADSDNRW